MSDNDFFTLKRITKLNEAKIGDVMPTSDFSILNDNGEFLQYTFTSIREDQKYQVSPGIYKIVKTGLGSLALTKTDFNSDVVLTDYDFTAKITSRIDMFFTKLNVYKHYGVFPKRGMLLHGKPGVGKSQAISTVCKQYSNAQDTAVVLWSTSDYDAGDVKDLIQTFEYIDGTNKMILVAEDIGGAEYVGAKMVIKSSLLSLLDNMEQTFKIPTMILATTNYPENLLEALTNRPQRFDDVLEIPGPNGEQRKKLLGFFLKNDGKAEADYAFVAEKKYDGLSIAHLKDVIIRAALYDLSLRESLEQVLAQSNRALAEFSKQRKMGIGSVIDDSE